MAEGENALRVGNAWQSRVGALMQRIFVCGGRAGSTTEGNKGTQLDVRSDLEAGKGVMSDDEDFR